MAGKKAKAKARKATSMVESPPSASPAPPLSSQYFEFRPSQGKGIGAFATKVITAGTTVLEEAPLMVIHKPISFVTERDVDLAYRKLSVEQRLVFDQMRFRDEKDSKLGRFRANNFTNDSDMFTATCFPMSSRFNHSCHANILNITIAPDALTHRFTAIREIQQGEELTFYYYSDFQFMTTKERHDELKESGQSFNCTCDHCSLPPAELYASDLRRALLRHLICWLRKRDLVGVRSTIKNKNIRFDLMKEGVYHLMVALLMEAEGLRCGEEAYLAWSFCIHHVMLVAYERRLETLSGQVVNHLLEWGSKSMAAVKLHYGDKVDEAGEAFIWTARILLHQMKQISEGQPLSWDRYIPPPANWRRDTWIVQ